MKIDGKCTEVVEVKRFYLPGIVCRDTCPKCNFEVTTDLAVSYLSYPTISAANVHFYCKNCENDWFKAARMEVTLTAQE